MTALAFLGLLGWWFQRHVEVVSDLTDIGNAPVTRIRLLKEQALFFLPVMAVCATKFLAGALGLALLPLSAGAIERATGSGAGSS